MGGFARDIIRVSFTGRAIRGRIKPHKTGETQIEQHVKKVPVRIRAVKTPFEKYNFL